MTQKRNRITQSQTLGERLAEEAERYRKAAEETPPGKARELLVNHARQIEAAANLNKLLSKKDA